MSEANVSGADTASAEVAIDQSNEGVEPQVSPEEVLASDDVEQSDVADQQEQEVMEEVARKLKLKIDGEETEYDLSNEEQLKKDLQLSRAAQKRMQEASEVRRQAEDFINQLKKNPKALLTNPELGINFRELAEDYLAEQLQEEMLSPEEKQQREMERRLKEYETQEQERKQKEEQQRMQELEQKYAEDFQTQIISALEGSGLPKSPKTIKRMAELQYISLQQGIEANPKDLVEMVRESYVNEIKDLFGQSDGETLLKLMGDDVAKKIRQSDLKRVKKPLQQGGSKAHNQAQNLGNSSPKGQQKLSPDEWSEQIRKRVLGE